MAPFGEGARAKDYETAILWRLIADWFIRSAESTLAEFP